MSTVLYSNDSSYYSMIARLVLAEKGVAYDLHKIDIHIKMEQFDPEYVKIQPNMTVPTLVCDGVTVGDSHKILFFVNENFPGANLYPEADAKAINESLARHYDFSIEDLTMGNAMRKSPIAKFALSKGLKKASQRCTILMTTHPELKEACEKKIQLEEQRYKEILSADNNYEQVKRRAVELCDMLEGKLSTNDFAASNQYTLADVVWTVFLARLFMIKFDYLIAERKNLQEYWQRMTMRDSFAKANLWTKMKPAFLLKVIIALVFRK